MPGHRGDRPLADLSAGLGFRRMPAFSSTPLPSWQSACRQRRVLPLGQDTARPSEAAGATLVAAFLPVC